MVRQAILVGAVCVAGIIIGCGEDPAGPGTQGDTPVPVPAGVTAVVSEGFGLALDADGYYPGWEPKFLINMGDPLYSQMTTTTAAAHTGTHSLTSDSNITALCYNVKDGGIKSRIAGVQFYMMTKAIDSTNLTVVFGKNFGSSGGLENAYGIGFDVTQKLKCTFKDKNGTFDTCVGAITVNKWYKCVVEIDSTTNVISYFIDDKQVYSDTATDNDKTIDRLLVIRGPGTMSSQGDFTAAKEGPKQYYVDDIVLYKK